MSRTELRQAYHWDTQAPTMGNVETTTMTGYASVYNMAVFEGTIAWRHEAGQFPADASELLEEYDGFIATMYCGYVGDDALLSYYVNEQKKMITKRVLVSDCAVRNDSDGTRTWMSENNIVAEIDSVLAEHIPLTTRGRYVKLTVFDTSDLYE